jgi:hypothetical protein
VRLPKNAQSSNNSIEEIDDLPPIEMVISSGFRKAKLQADLSKTPAHQTVNELAVEKISNASNYKSQQHRGVQRVAKVGISYPFHLNK